MTHAAAFFDDVSAILNEYATCNSDSGASAVAIDLPSPAEWNATAADSLKASLDTLASVAAAAVSTDAAAEKPYLTTPALVKVPTQRGVDGYVVLWYVSDERNGAIHNKNKSAIVTVIEPEKYKKVESPRKVYTSLSMPGTQMRENVQINGWKMMFAVAANDGNDGVWQPLDVFRVQSGGGGIRNTDASKHVNALHQAGKYAEILNLPLPQHIATQLAAAAATGITVAHKKRNFDAVDDVVPTRRTTKRRTTTTTTIDSDNKTPQQQRRSTRITRAQTAQVDNDNGVADDQQQQQQQQQLMTAEQVQQLLDAMRQQHESQMAQLKQQYEERCNALEQRLAAAQQAPTMPVHSGIITTTTTTQEEIFTVVGDDVSKDVDATIALISSSDEQNVLIASLYDDNNDDTQPLDLA